MIADLVRAAIDRTAAIVDRLDTLGPAALEQPSMLPDWNRLTIVCHLRYGAEAFGWMTADALEGRTTAYYRRGRAAERPGTLTLRPDESPTAALRSLVTASRALDARWRAVAEDDWTTPMVEPPDNHDLGPLMLDALPLARLTEVEVHGSDLDIGLPPWSDTFVTAALPFRLRWLNTRRSNHRAVDQSVQGAWLLDPTDGPTFLVSTDGVAVRAEPAASNATADATISGTSRDLLALLLGRVSVESFTVAGDVALANAFTRAFPGP